MTETRFEKMEIKNWENFVKFVNETDTKVPPKRGFVYRGQSDEKYDLQPSFNRHFGSLKFKPEILLDIERVAQEKFKTQAHLYISTNLIRHTITVMDWWMLMQHHQAPTRLLDWTESAYVAAYHACEGGHGKNGAVWLLHGGYLEKKMKELDDYDGFPSDIDRVNDHFLSHDTSKIIYMANASFKTDRMLAQQGLFSVCKDISGNQHK
ncbi:MAG: FRG domain-containing protein [Candidatus Scalindua sp.]|nr:FRG domain-containing protein [Candidatus Scalindua sp.]